MSSDMRSDPDLNPVISYRPRDKRKHREDIF